MNQSAKFPARCAAIIDIANGMIRVGQAESGRAMLEDLLKTAERQGCGNNPACAVLLHQVHEVLQRAREFEAEREPA